MTIVSRIKALLEPDGRWLAILIIAGYFSILFGISLATHKDISNAWLGLGVPALPVQFRDLQDIAVGIDRFQAGGHSWSPENVAYSTAAYNYTKWWLYAEYLGFNLKTYRAFAFGLIFLFFISSLYVLGRLSFFEGLVAGIVLISPDVMTAIERANGDLLIFALMALALALRRFIPLSALIIVLASTLKIYPAASLLALARPPWRKTLPWLAIAFVLLAINLVSNFQQMQQIATAAERLEWFSFGSATFLLKLLDPTFNGAFGSYHTLVMVGDLLLLVIVAGSVWARPRVKFEPKWEKALMSFRFGATLYVGTFALGSNFDFKTIVLIFCLPLFFILRNESGSISRWAYATLILIVAYTNWRLYAVDEIRIASMAAYVAFLLKQLMAWSLVVCLTGIFAGLFEWRVPGRGKSKQ